MPVPADRLTSISRHASIFSNHLEKAMPKTLGELDMRDRNPFLGEPIRRSDAIAAALIVVGFLMAGTALLLPLLVELYTRWFQ